MAVCCEGRAGLCAERYLTTGGARVEDWNPGVDDALRLSFDLTSRPDADANNGDVVTATVRSATSTVDGWKSSPPASTHSIAALFASGIGPLGQALKDLRSSHQREASIRQAFDPGFAIHEHLR